MLIYRPLVVSGKSAIQPFVGTGSSYIRFGQYRRIVVSSHQRKQQIQSRSWRSLATYSNASLNRRSSTGLAMGPRQKRMEATQRILQEQEKSDLVVVLDMDECLIHAKFLDANAAKYAHQLNEKDQQDHHQGQSEQVKPIERFTVTLTTGDVVSVARRPHLHEFLQKVSSRFETHIFTAALPIYAQPVLDQLDPLGNMFHKRWFRGDCRMKNSAYVKDLSILNKDERRLVLVDNNPDSFLNNPSNGILVNSFYDDPLDNSLMEVLGLLEELDGQSDVRPYLEKKFKLNTAPQELE